MSVIQQIQQLLGVTTDGIFGPKSQAALDAIIRPVAGEPPSGGRVDDRSEMNIATLHLKVQPLARRLIQQAVENGMNFKITSGTRTYAEQDEIYAHGRTKPGPIVTNARGGYSSHNFATAFDVTLFFDGNTPVYEHPFYRRLGSLGRGLGLSWGGDWTNGDEPHHYLKPGWAKEMSESQMMSELRRRHDNNIDVFA